MQSRSGRGRLATMTAVLVALAIGGATYLWTMERPPTGSASADVVREVMASGLPGQASGQRLELVRYTIPPGVVLPMHTHPGTQAAWVESGVLRYTVVEGGSTPITRARAAGGPSERLNPGESTDIHAGDSLVEVEGAVHYGENLGARPVIIWAATLLDPDRPPAAEHTPGATP